MSLVYHRSWSAWSDEFDKRTIRLMQDGMCTSSISLKGNFGDKEVYRYESLRFKMSEEDVKHGWTPWMLKELLRYVQEEVNVPKNTLLLVKPMSLSTKEKESSPFLSWKDMKRYANNRMKVSSFLSKYVD